MSQLEIVGPASAWLKERAQTYCDALGGPWGTVPDGRLVIAADFAATLREYLPTERYEAWAQRQQDRARHGAGYGLGFTASDGIPTAVAAVLPDAADLLGLCCHELGELALGEDDGPSETMHAAMAGVVWSEHVVERRRAEVFIAQQWPRGVMDRSFLTESLTTYQTRYPQLLEWAARTDAVPGEIYGAWQMITRDVVCAYARSQAGNDDEEREVEGFLNGQMMAQGNAWLDLMLFCDRAYEHPELSHQERHEFGRLEGWLPLFDALRRRWNADYETAVDRLS